MFLRTGMTQVSSRKLDWSTESPKSTSVISKSSFIREAALVGREERVRREGGEGERDGGGKEEEGREGREGREDILHLRAGLRMMLVLLYQYCNKRCHETQSHSC